ncbi:PPR domain-containing protein/PPR_2 domain-containing protein/PPR_3 domain-containing protein/DYW_deaminase domain-containing protein [Cephalotus follicularis]|uniref:PPR domain-containing protein/PPR_2 domain-containing protein/PPR_3 domain-containing protein/DYW_deaminase domain-containing protein n=1 Tax=Cephalotus follicularis TaxID=3775 RepID=A0A1Q3C7K9_CEPFO|nr:PPR domain-containing protein/PPR_2 domain-containing protein/PPR_3 domain-containing protein/DYW_deaminase domain-containing protein [Cephalotus follicularis]
MRNRGIHLFENLNSPVLNCINSATASLSQTRQAHAYILKTGVSNDTHFATKLLSLYANHGCFADANLVLSSIPDPSVFSFSSLIYALTKFNLLGQSLLVFSRMASLGLAPDSRVLPNITKACAGLSSLKSGQQVHGIANVSGFSLDVIVQSSLIHMYVKCGQMDDARKVFDRLPQPDVVACSALVAGYARQGCVEKAHELFNEMRGLGLEPNLVSWNGVIAGFNHSGRHYEAAVMFKKMHLEGFNPDEGSVSSVLPALGDLEMLDTGIQVHGYVIVQGLGQDKCVVTALIDMYAKCACTLELSRVFDEMEDRDIGACNALITGLSRNGLFGNALELFRQFKDQGMELNVVSWTSMIASCSQNGKDIEALELFREMQFEGMKPNSVTIPCILPACANTAALMHGKAAHCFSLRSGISNDVYVGSALVDMYAKCGKIQISRLCFDNIPIKNLVCWNAIMRGYAMHGKVNEAMEIFHMMLKSRQKPDCISFTCILSACSQVGLMDQGWVYFNSMSRDHGIEPKVEHYACMITLMGRAGKLEEAYTMIKQMPFQPDGCVWGALLSSCRVHKNVILGEAAAKKLFKLEPKNPGNYILLSNIYASKAMWAEVDTLRDTMKSMGLRKNPGCSWIEIKNKVHMLLAGDKSHPQMTQIMGKLNKLSMEMKKSGYFPNTDFVLHDVEEQDKEQILCGHSEKLAVVLGLLNTLPGTSLQVIKNLRICDDCHAVIKYISRFEGREIFVRDTNRFHHFKDGVCSCGDYW